jgi:hypothetical protein
LDNGEKKLFSGKWVYHQPKFGWSGWNMRLNENENAEVYNFTDYMLCCVKGILTCNQYCYEVIYTTKGRLRFSQWWLWILLLSDIWNHVVRWIVTGHFRASCCLHLLGVTSQRAVTFTLLESVIFSFCIF